MNDTAAGSGDTAVYWRTWGVLLGLTLVMFLLDRSPMPRLLFVVVMISAMMVKAGLIAGIFMHLRHESADLVISIAVTTLGLGALLYLLIVVDAYRILATLVG